MEQILTNSSSSIQFQEFFTNRHTVIAFDVQTKIALCTVKTVYIPMAEFQILFSEISKLVKKEKITKFIFDKRELTTFHQPSMEWYHLVWKKEMFDLGLRSHRKLLPDNLVFEQSVQNGRKKIARENPDFDFNKYDIIYCKSLEEAIEK